MIAAADALHIDAIHSQNIEIPNPHVCCIITSQKSRQIFFPRIIEIDNLELCGHGLMKLPTNSCSFK